MDLNRKVVGSTRQRPTPLVLFDCQVVRQKYALIRKSLPLAEVFYAIKANPHPHIVATLHGLGCGFEVSSGPELRLAVEAGATPEKLICSNPVKAPEFIRQAREAGVVHFAVDSVEDIRKMARHAPGAQLRLRLAVDNSQSEWPLGGKYGAQPQEIPELLAAARSLGLPVTGLTFHVGSQCLSAESWIRALEACRAVFDVARELGHRMSLINLGGGLPIKYTRPVPEIEAIGSKITEFVATTFPEVERLEVEPGRALVGDAAVLVASVIGKAVRSGKRWLYLDAGVYNCLLESLGGIRYEMRAEVGGPVYPHTVAGPSCDSTDVITHDALLPDLAVGDRVYVLNVGAYSLSYVTQFGGFPSPEVHFLE